MVFTPKGWECLAQGQERSDAALGTNSTNTSPERAGQRELSQSFGLHGATGPTQGVALG